MSQREATRRAVRAEAALVEARRQVEAMQHALLSTGPLVRFLKLYDQLDQAAEPLTGRQFERSTPPHPFDRPMPHISTVQARRTLGLADRAIGRLCDQIADFLNGESRPGPVCLCCGRPDRTGRPPLRRRQATSFLQANLTGPVPEELIVMAAQQQGISRSTLNRAARECGVVRSDTDGQRIWRLEAG